MVETWEFVIYVVVSIVAVVWAGWASYQIGRAVGYDEAKHEWAWWWKEKE